MTRNPRTHCRSGRHELTPENVYVHKNGDRHCKPCQLEREIAQSRARGVQAWQPPAMPTDPAILGYAAGIIDGEGTIGIKLQKNGHNPNAIYHTFKVRASNTDRRLIDWMQETFGGSVATKIPKQRNRKVSYYWSIPSGTGTVFLRAVRPYLRVKGEQADVALALAATKLRTGNGVAGMLTDELFDYRESLRRRMMELNYRGVAA